MLKKLAIVAVCGTYLSACTTTDPYTGEQKMSNTAGGAAIGAGIGALGGLVIGGGNKGRNALIGAGIGALAGGAIGSYMDNQEAELRAQLQGTGVSVTRVGDRIILNMPSNITFATDQDQVIPPFYRTLDSVALVLNKFNKTLVDVNGHTDSTGSVQHNQDLSMRRASRLPIIWQAAMSISAACRRWASAPRSRLPAMQRRMAARRTAASKCRSRRSRRVDCYRIMVGRPLGRLAGQFWRLATKRAACCSVCAAAP